MENNKKTLILSVVGILVLVIAVIGVSFAMFSFSGTGTKTNVIQTGTVTLDFADSSNYFTLDNKYPMSDEKGIAATDNDATFGVHAAWGQSQMTINYDLLMTNITEGATLKADKIKVALLKGDQVVVGSTAGTTNLTAGVKVSTLDKVGNDYKLTSGTFSTTDTTDTYTISAWVSEDYDLPTTDTSAGLKQELQTTSETFSFKISVVATQA